MDAVDLGVNLFVALFALMDPIGNLPIFAAATAGASLRQRISVSALICVFIVVFLAFFFFTGLINLQAAGLAQDQMRSFVYADYGLQGYGNAIRRGRRTESD